MNERMSDSEWTNEWLNNERESDSERANKSNKSK